MNRITAGLAVLGTAAATVALSAPALAQTDTIGDPRGDMDHGADIHRVKVANEDVVRVKVTHRDLVRSPRSGSSISVFLDVDRGKAGPEYILVGGTYDGTDYALVKAGGWSQGRRVNSSTCDYRMNVDYAADTATVTIDRDCLDNPGAVRVAVRTSGATGDDMVHDWLAWRRQFTPWVARG